MITLSSDFGSPYPAAMRGVLLRRTDARLVDVAHDFPRQDVRATAFWLRFVLPEFPPATHLAAVDPGVGTDRAALIVRAGEHALVGPDNGLLVPAARRLAALGEGNGASGFEAFVADDPAPASNTFHGRDVFAPLAARVHEAGVESVDSLDGLRPASDVVDLTIPEPTVTDGRATGEVLAVDGFGNVVTNLPGKVLDRCDVAVVNGERVPIGTTFASVSPGERLLTVGSHGNVECDVNRGRGDEAFGLNVGDPVVVEVDADD